MPNIPMSVSVGPYDARMGFNQNNYQGLGHPNQRYRSPSNQNPTTSSFTSPYNVKNV